tara:strand:- start:200 stop:1297 length:1098 start_codon:yes stop_codon:yes gene_type:complete
MIRSFTINRYLAKNFLIVLANLSLGFFCLGFIINLFEEINFFKDYNVEIEIPIALTFLFVPSLIYNLFPFIVFLSGIWFFLKFKKTDEIITLRVSGMSNFSLMIVPGILCLILGIFFITAVNPITSLMVKKYEKIKGSYEIDQEYLAAITVNGIWIMEKNKYTNKKSIIRSTRLDGEDLSDITVYEFDANNNFIKRIEAESANIRSTDWLLKNVKVTDRDGNKIELESNSLIHKSTYNIDKIKTLYSNLDTISFWNLKNEIKTLEDRGYSTREVRGKLQRSLTFPFFLLSMLLLSGVFTLGMQFKETRWIYLFISISVSVLIFYFMEFSTALGNTEKLPIEASVWLPILIIFIFSTVGIIHANQK